MKWYAKNKRTLPWRDLTVKEPNQRAYLIWVSEVMLQQTQVPRVIPTFKRFIEQFPTLASLGKASNRDVLIAWRGMGYNSRALRLRDGAQIIVEKLNGSFPDSVEGLRSIKGIGEYTAGAIRNFAFGIPTPCIDTNIRRILHRFFVGPERADGTWRKDDRYLIRLAKEVLEVALMQPSPRSFREHPSPHRGEGTGLPAGQAGVRALSTVDWHAALMDYGALICTKNNPKWEKFSPGMKEACKAYGSKINRTKNLNKREPGRIVGGRFIPNRIFRGRIVEALRDHPQGLTPKELGERITVDWSMGRHGEWLQGLVQGLAKEGLIQRSAGRFALSV